MISRAERASEFLGRISRNEAKSREGLEMGLLFLVKAVAHPKSVVAEIRKYGIGKAFREFYAVNKHLLNPK